VDEILKELLAVEDDDGDPFEIAGVQDVIGLDVDLIDIERRGGTQPIEDRAGLLAQVATRA
jgi:hypothetical protein